MLPLQVFSAAVNGEFDCGDTFSFRVHSRSEFELEKGDPWKGKKRFGHASRLPKFQGSR